MSKSKYDGVDMGNIEKRIENGYSFEVSSKLSIANVGAKGKWLFRTGKKVVVILSRAINSNGDELDYQAFKSPTVSADGTPVTVGKRNGNSKIEPQVQFFATPTTTADGSGIPPVYMPGSVGLANSSFGQFNQDGFVRELEPETTYLLQVTNNGTKNPAITEVYLLWTELNNPAPAL